MRIIFRRGVVHANCETGKLLVCGVWRSLVARSAGGREVAGSNPVAPMIENPLKTLGNPLFSRDFAFDVFFCEILISYDCLYNFCKIHLVVIFAWIELVIGIFVKEVSRFHGGTVHFAADEDGVSFFKGWNAVDEDRG